MTTTQMHCGMCEHDWRARRTKPSRCPSCGSDEIETHAEAATHNSWVIAYHEYCEGKQEIGERPFTYNQWLAIEREVRAEYERTA